MSGANAKSTDRGTRGGLAGDGTGDGLAGDGTGGGLAGDGTGGGEGDAAGGVTAEDAATDGGGLTYTLRGVDAALEQAAANKPKKIIKAVRERRIVPPLGSSEGCDADGSGLLP